MKADESAVALSSALSSAFIAKNVFFKKLIPAGVLFNGPESPHARQRAPYSSRLSHNISPNQSFFKVFFKEDEGQYKKNETAVCLRSEGTRVSLFLGARAFHKQNLNNSDPPWSTIHANAHINLTLS
jgi:hypothetical protein